MSENFRNKILKIHVNAGCCSPEKILLTFQGIGQQLKLKDVQEVLEKCTLCNSIENFHRPRKSAPGITIAKETNCQQTIFIDHKTILTKDRLEKIRDNCKDPDYSPESDKQSCLTVFEPVSSVVWMYPVDNYSSETVKEALRLFFMVNGPSKNVVADNAASFVALGDWLKKDFDCSLHHTSVYHPNSNLSERAHREFEKVLKVYDASSGQSNSLNWEDALTKACIAMNSLKHAQWKVSPYEVFKNRIQCDVHPPQFYPVGMERKIVNEKFVEKVEKIVKSKLKIVLPVFKKGDSVKVEIPNELERFGVITATKDHCFKQAVTIKFGKARPVSINKDFICISRNQQATSAPRTKPNEQNPNSETIIEEKIDNEWDETGK